MDYFLATLFIIICVLLIVVVLLQKGRGGGLSGAFGGAGGSSAFGTRTGDVFTWVTIVLTALFLLLAIGTTMAFRPKPSIVMAPQFLPPPSPIEQPTAVKLSSETPDAEIYYTLDGTEPSKESKLSQQYQGTAISIAPGTIIKAKAYRERWTPSQVSIGDFRAAGATTAPAIPAGAPSLQKALPATQPAGK